ncbi:hypothetical protein AXG93_3102s1650 [Marchantia polymorpha subsp. ruderalis]|uniref:Uncharacterized protein n=1 Tax=Marchantia polymorpha subsp. ruderalis TaxID=1480154 RepID=A0A176W8A4_MARPO|nr:hypothetical protein AXG93_3102s1650 [Marchantia polymorpha subsp. ruderalis]
MVRKWLREKYKPSRGYRPQPERWRVNDWEQAPRKWKLGEEGKERRRESVAVPSRRRATNEQARPKQKARKLIWTAGSSADTGRTAISKESPSLEEEDGSTGVLGRSLDLPAPKAHVPSVRGTPTGVLCEQVVPLLRYLDRKVAKYMNPRLCGSFVELVRNRTRIKVATNPKLIVLDQKYRQLEERYNFRQDQWALARKLQKAALKLQDEMVTNSRRENNELRAKVQTNFRVEQIQIRNLTDELVWKTQALEQSEATRRVDEELLGRLQS